MTNSFLLPYLNFLKYLKVFHTLILGFLKLPPSPSQPLPLPLKLVAMSLYRSPSPPGIPDVLKDLETFQFPASQLHQLHSPRRSPG